MYNRPLRRVFGIFLARCRVLTCIRPLMRAISCRGPVWCSQIRSKSKPRARWHVAQLVFLILSHDRFAKGLLALFRSDVSRLLTTYIVGAGALNTTAGHQGPYDPRHLVCQCDPHQHSWLTVDHVAQPCSVSFAPACTFRLMITLLAPMISKRRSDLSPILVVAPRRYHFPLNVVGARGLTMRQNPGLFAEGLGRWCQCCKCRGDQRPGCRGLSSAAWPDHLLWHGARSLHRFVISASRWRSDRTRTCRVAIARKAARKWIPDNPDQLLDVGWAPCGTT